MVEEVPGLIHQPAGSFSLFEVDGRANLSRGARFNMSWPVPARPGSCFN
jgi:hypothetical protein